MALEQPHDLVFYLDVLRINDAHSVPSDNNVVAAILHEELVADLIGGGILYPSAIHLG